MAYVEKETAAGLVLCLLLLIFKRLDSFVSFPNTILIPAFYTEWRRPNLIVKDTVKGLW